MLVTPLATLPVWTGHTDTDRTLFFVHIGAQVGLLRV